jgi:hypothetical protein
MMHPTSRWIDDVTAATMQVEGRSDIARMLVCSRIVTCGDDEHYAITDGDSAEELERAHQALRGRCTCGTPLSVTPRRAVCRRCDPEYRRVARGRRRPGHTAPRRSYGVARALSRLIRQWVRTS